MEWSPVSKVKLEMCVVTQNSIDKINAPKIVVEEFF